MADARDPRPEIRRAQRVLLMVHELHKQGFQLLRIIPGMSASGAYWRCTVTPRSNVLKTHGAQARDFDGSGANYTSGQGAAYSGWQDATHDTARELASKFLARFPAIAEQGRGRDWEYARWYVKMLGFAERGMLPIAYADWYEEPDLRWLPTTAGFNSGLPMPPAGDAEPEDGRP